MDFNDPFYRNGDNLKDDMWPCRLKESNIPKISQSKLGTHFIDKLQPKETPSAKQTADTKPTQVKLKRKPRTRHDLKVVNRKKQSFKRLSN